MLKIIRTTKDLFLSTNPMSKVYRYGGGQQQQQKQPVIKSPSQQQQQPRQQQAYEEQQEQARLSPRDSSRDSKQDFRQASSNSSREVIDSDRNGDEINLSRDFLPPPQQYERPKPFRSRSRSPSQQQHHLQQGHHHRLDVDRDHRDQGGRFRSRSRSRDRSDHRHQTHHDPQQHHPPPSHRPNNLSEEVLVEKVEVGSGAGSYLLGRGGGTKNRLSNFSGCFVDMDARSDFVSITGTRHQRDLAKLSIDITMQQRNGGRVAVDFEALEQRDDTVTVDIPKHCVGFVLGRKGATLREMETRHRTFMFFDNDQEIDGCKRLFIIGGKDERFSALDEITEMVQAKLSGAGSGGGGGGGGGGRGGGEERHHSKQYHPHDNGSDNNGRVW